jgi:hypothetical protein
MRVCSVLLCSYDRSQSHIDTMFAQMLFLLHGLLASTVVARPPGLAFFPVNAPKGKTVQNLCRDWKAACQWVTGNVCVLPGPVGCRSRRSRPIGGS